MLCFWFLFTDDHCSKKSEMNRIMYTNKNNRYSSKYCYTVQTFSSNSQCLGEHTVKRLHNHFFLQYSKICMESQCCSLLVPTIFDLCRSDKLHEFLENFKFIFPRELRMSITVFTFIGFCCWCVLKFGINFFLSRLNFAVRRICHWKI